MMGELLTLVRGSNPLLLWTRDGRFWPVITRFIVGSLPSWSPVSLVCLAGKR